MKLPTKNDIIGMCTVCKEWTDVNEPCCGAGVMINGNIYEPKKEVTLEDFKPAQAELDKLRKERL